MDRSLGSGRRAAVAGAVICAALSVFGIVLASRGAPRGPRPPQAAPAAHQRAGLAQPTTSRPDAASAEVAGTQAHGSEPAATAAAPAVAAGAAPAAACPVQPLAGDGTWPVRDGANGDSQVPACGILTNVEVPSRSQWITTGSPARCSWSTFASPTASPDSLIAQSSGSGPQIMAFTDAVAAVRSLGCGSWAPWPASDSYWLVQPQPSTAPFGDGTRPFWMGISDGSWVASGGPSCRWSVLRDFTGRPDDVIAEGSTPRVTMAMPSGGELTGDNHGGFSSQGCGTWTYVGGGTLG